MSVQTNDTRGRLLQLRCNDKEFSRWSERADERGVTLSSWVRLTLNDAVSDRMPVHLPSVITNPQSAPRSVITDDAVRVLDVEFQRPATWVVHLDNGKSWPVSKKVDPRSKQFARTDLLAWCSNENAIGFDAAWREMESNLQDGGFSQ